MSEPQYNYRECLPDNAFVRLLDYASHLRLVDTYWEYYVLFAQMYEIYVDDQYAGAFCLQLEEQVLSALFLEDKFLRYSQRIFADILSKFVPKFAYAVSSDELYLSLLADYAAANGKVLELQAYFFDDVSAVKLSPRHAKLRLVKAEEKHLADIKSLDFFDDLSLNSPIETKYMLYDNGVLLGAGHIQTMRLAPGLGAVGMVVSPDYRNKQLGKAIILLEKQICFERGLTPIAGCWYYNHASKRTLEACGFASKTRLFRLNFEEAVD